VERAIVDGASPDTWEGPLSPLRCAVQAHNLPLLQLLLTQGANANAKDHRGVGALHMAVFDGRVECIKLLLDAQADPNIGDRHGQTPLFFAPSRVVCELLIARRADLTVRNAKKQSPLHLAAHAGLDDAVSWFVDGDRIAADALDAKGFTPMSYAAHSHVSSTVSFLKQKAEAAAASSAVSRAADEATECRSLAVLAAPPAAEEQQPPKLPPERPGRPPELEAAEDEEDAPAKAAAAIADATVMFAREPEATECATPDAICSEPASPVPEPKRQRHVTIEVDDDEAPPRHLGPVPEEGTPPKAEQPAPEAQAKTVPSAAQSALNRQVAAAMRARGVEPVTTPQLTPESQTPNNAFELESEDSEEARAENRVPNKEVVPEEVDGCLEWEVMLKKEASTDKFGFVQANGKLDFETRLANPCQRLVTMGKRPLMPAESSPLPGPTALIVRKVHEGLLLHCWNQKYPQIAVRPQDRILSVNGEASLEAMQREIKSAKIVIKFKRYPEMFTARLTKNNRRLGFRFEKPTSAVDSKGRSKELRITEICPDGAVPDYNREMALADRHHYVLLPDMRITQANDIVGDGGEIAEELKRCEEVTLTLRRADLPSSQTRKLRMLAAAMRGGSASAISDADGGSTVAFSWVPGASTCDGGYSPQGGSPTGAGPTLSTALED